MIPISKLFKKFIDGEREKTVRFVEEQIKLLEENQKKKA